MTKETDPNGIDKKQNMGKDFVQKMENLVRETWLESKRKKMLLFQRRAEAFSKQGHYRAAEALERAASSVAYEMRTQDRSNLGSPHHLPQQDEE